MLVNHKHSGGFLKPTRCGRLISLISLKPSSNNPFLTTTTKPGPKPNSLKTSLSHRFVLFRVTAKG